MELPRKCAYVRLVTALVFLEMQISLTMAAAECPLDLSKSNFKLVASLCTNKEDRGKCCRFINALIAVAVSRYANATSNLGVSSDLSDTCLQSVSQTFNLYGITKNAIASCGFGTKITVNYECQGRSTVYQMESPKFSDVTAKCVVPLSEANDCRECLNAGLLYLRNLIGPVDNVTLSTCRDATFTAIASRVDYLSTIDIASCFFGVRELSSGTIYPLQASPPTPAAGGPTQLSLNISPKQIRHPYHITLVPVIAVAVTSCSIALLVVLIILIRQKQKQLNETDETSLNTLSLPARKFQDGPSCMFRKFTYKETQKATNNFSIVIGQGGFGIVYKAEFQDGLVAAVKRMSKVSEQAEDDFCREIDLLARLHHRHLVALRGFCIQRHERFLMYEFMANGSLKDHLHTPGESPLSWCTRIQIAIDVANALEYLHYYCDPPLCHRDIKSSNILLDGNFTAKVADFGLLHASKDGSICFESVNTDIRGTPGYLDPEYVITHEVTEKSDIYSYGVVLLELITGRKAIQDGKNLVEWSQPSLESGRLTELLDPHLGDAFEFDQLQTALGIVRWCTQGEGRERPSIKQVLRVLYESSDPMHSGFVEAVGDDEENGRKSSKGKSNMFSSGDGGVRGLASSSSTTRSYCSRTFLLETGDSPHNITLSI